MRNELRLTTIDVARLTGQRSDNVLRAVRRYIQRHPEAVDWFSADCYLDPNGHQRYCYGCSLLGFVAILGARGAVLLEALIRQQLAACLPLPARSERKRLTALQRAVYAQTAMAALQHRSLQNLQDVLGIARY